MNDRPVEIDGMGAHDPGMDARVTRIEDQFGRFEVLLNSIDNRLHKLEIDGAELRARIPQLATREDLADIKGRMSRLATREDVAELNGRVAQLATRDDVAKTREAVAEIKGRVSQHPTTLALIGFAIAVLAAGGFMRHF